MDPTDTYRLTITTKDDHRVCYLFDDQANAFARWQRVRDMIPRYQTVVTSLTLDRLDHHGTAVNLLAYYRSPLDWQPPTDME